MWLLFLCIVASDGEQSIGFAAAIDEALNNNTTLLAVHETETEIAAAIDEARAAAFPQLDFKMGTRRSRDPGLLNSPDFEGLLEFFPDGKYSPATNQIHRGVVELNQPLYTFGRIRSAIELARIVEHQNRDTIQTAELDVAYQVALAWLDLANAIVRYDVQLQERESRQLFLETVSARLEFGEATQLEFLRAKSARLEIEPGLTRSETDVALAKRTLKRLLGRSSLVTVTSDSSPAAASLAPDLEVLTRYALSHRPQLRHAQQQQLSLEKQAEIRQSGGLPQIELNATYGRESIDFDNLDESLYATWSASLDFSWSLFDGGRRRSQIEQLTSRRRQSQLMQDDLREQIILEVEKAHANLVSARQEHESTNANVNASEEAERVAKASYKEGVALYSEWLDAQQEARRARLRNVEARFNVARRRASLKRAIGIFPHQPWPHGGVE